MTLKELDEYFNGFLHKENYSSDPSKNGIQIENSDLTGKQIKKIAFAVDACCTTAEKAAEAGAGLLFVHHGLFWGGCNTITGTHYKRINSFLKNDLALYASHIPLDANSEVGNNYGLAFKLGLKNLESFGFWHGMCIGVKGEFEKPLSLTEIAQKALRPCAAPKFFPFGKETVQTLAIISGGAGEDHVQAAQEGVDAYLTGEFIHEDFHSAEECGISVIAGGHYETEIVGVNLVRQKVEKELGLETIFIDIPTGL